MYKNKNETLLNNIKQNKINWLIMHQFGNVLLTIDKVKHITTEGSGLWTRLRWVKPGLWPNYPTPSV